MTTELDNFEQILSKLTKLELFSDFHPNKENDVRILKILYENLSLKKFKAGDLIIKEGDRGDDFFILNTGTVQVQQKTPANDTIAIANLDASLGIFFGEAALISHDVRSASVIALTDSSAIVLSGKKFLDLAEKEPILGYRVTYRIAQRLAATIKKTNRDRTVLYEALLNEVDGNSEANA
jgi:CRP/FNR family transcriptional regulator, cyclic AMP receptor protein